MANRITNGMMYGMLFNNMQSNLAQMLKYQEQMTTQRMYSKASDNPIAVARGVGLSTALYENAQYIKNQEDAVSWLKASDTAFNQLLTTAQRIRELTIYAGDGALGVEELKAISVEINELKEQLRNTANTSIAGKYLFSGLDTATKPFSYDAFGRIVYGGSGKKINFEIENSVVSEVSFTGSEIFSKNEKTYNVKSQYVPIDWTWKGREEKVQIRLGETIVKIQIPEQWIDEVATGNTKSSDFNQFRDPDEVRGLTMDQVAELFNRALKDGGANKLIGVKVEKDTANGVQRLVFTSNTGEPMQITGWPDTDMAPMEQSLAGLVLDPLNLPNWNNTPGGGNPPTIKGLMGEVNTYGWAPGITLPTKTITINVGTDSHTFNLNAYADSTKLITAINDRFRPATGAPEVAALENGRIVLRATDDISVSGNGTDELFGITTLPATPIKSSISSLTFRVGDGQPMQIFINDGDDLDDIAKKIEAVTGLAARISPDGKQLVVVAKRDRPLAEDMLASNDAAETLAYPKFTINASGAALLLFDFQITRDNATGIDQGVTASQEIRRPTDHSHIDLLDYLGMETTLKSVEFPAGKTLDVVAPGLHWRVISGNNQVDLKLSAGSYTMEQIAERLRNAGLGWLEVTVDVAASNPKLDATESGLGTSNNYEAGTSRLVIRAVQNAPVTFLDMNGEGYASKMGLSTAIRTDNPSRNPVEFPTALCLDGKTPAYLKVVVGDGKTYTVKLNQKDIVDPATGFVDRNKVMEQIAKQVNEQSGMELLRVIKDADKANSSIIATTGEPMMITDLPVPDSSWSTYTMGIAMQMGIHAGITATPAVDDNDMLPAGTIRIRSLGRMIDIDVAAGDTVKDVLDKIRDQAGSWLEVNYFDPDMSNTNPGIMFAISAKDGSPVSMYDIVGDVAQNSLRSDNVVNGTVDLTVAANWPTFADGDVLTISVAGYSHTIDLFAMQLSAIDRNGVCTPQDLVDQINARFQDEDIRAELDDDGELNLYSPRGYNIEVDNSGTNPPNRAADIFGTNFKNSQRGGVLNGINSQLNTIRSGPNTSQANFFDVLGNLSATMEAENRQALSNFLLPQIDRFIDNLLRCRASEGALENRYSNNIARFKTNDINLTELFDSVVGVDLSKVATDFAMLNAMYQASLSVVSQIIKPTLVDFLR